MQVSAITAAFTGSQRQTPTSEYFGQQKRPQKEFEEFLFSSETRNVSNEDVDSALERALDRVELLVGSELAQSVVNDDGSINITRFTQVMNSTEQPYGTNSRATPANTPQMVNLIA